MNYHKKAIDLLKGEFDWRNLCFSIAATNPKAFIDAVERMGVNWNKLFQGLTKIEAIKLYREKTGASLKDAKEFVEAVQNGDADEQRN